MEGLNRPNDGDCGANNMALTKMDSQIHGCPTLMAPGKARGLLRGCHRIKRCLNIMEDGNSAIHHLC